MDWYYAIGNERKGPVNGTQLKALFAQGIIDQNSLVWREGMANWQPYSALAADVEASIDPGIEGDAADLATCAFSGEVRPRSEMLQYGDHWVLAEHKDAFVRSLQEGSAVLPGERMTRMEFVGFWFRVLACVIDYFVKLVPSMLFSIPYFVITFRNLPEAMENPESFEAMTGGPFQSAGGLIAYLLSVVGTVGFSIFYETWMVGKYGGTLGKLALSIRIVNADGTKVSFGKAFGRWWAEVLTKTVMFVVGYGLVAVVAVVVGAGAFATLSGGGQPDPAALLPIIGVIAVVSLLAFPLGGFGYWMCSFNKEKKTLHDMICGTRVVRK